jgi:WNK lysine deficient protein kinase
MPSVKPNPSDKDSEPFVETDPTGHDSRYNELLGSSACKKVYKAFDQEEGIEVA